MQRVVNYRAGEELAVRVPLNKITVSHNPRVSIRGMLDLMHQKAFSEDPAVRQEYVDHIQEKRPDIYDLANDFRSMTTANRIKGQLQPITLRSFRVKADDGYAEHYGISQGERRTLAWGVIAAETGEPQSVLAIIKKLTVDEAFDLGFTENLLREDMNELEIGEALHEYLTIRINKATGKPYTISELAEKFGKRNRSQEANYHWVRGRSALHFLPDDEKKKVAKQFENAMHGGRRVNITNLCARALKYKMAASSGEEAEPMPDISTEVSRKPGRIRTKPVKDVYSFIDDTPIDNHERLRAFADVLGLTLDQVIAGRSERLAEVAAKSVDAA